MGRTTQAAELDQRKPNFLVVFSEKCPKKTTLRAIHVSQVPENGWPLPLLYQFLTLYPLPLSAPYGDSRPRGEGSLQRQSSLVFSRLCFSRSSAASASTFHAAMRK